MTLRKKTLIIIGITLIALIAILYGASRIILLRSFAELETQNIRQNVERAMSGLSESIADLSRSTADWAAWDDTYAFIENVNEDYIKANLVDGTFSELRLNLMLFVNSSGEIIFGKGFDLIEVKKLPIPKSFLEHLSAHQTLLQHLDIKSTGGIVLLPDGPVLISSHPIVTSEDEGPIRGTLLMGRYLDSRETDHLAETLHLSLTLHRFEDSQTLPDLQTINLPMLKESPILIKPLTEHSIVGYALLNDMYGEPALVLRVDMPREIYQQARASLAYYLYSFIGLGLAFIMITLLLLEKMVLSRLARLHSDVSNIGTSRDLYEGVSLPGKDEFSSLADRINSMFEALRESQRSLKRSHEELELRVEERTTALSKANEELKAEIVNRRRAEEALRESEERFKILFEFAPDAYYLHDLEGEFINGNRVAEELIGYKRRELIGKSFLKLKLLPPKQIPKAAAALAKNREGEPTGPDEFTLIRKDRTKVSAEISTFPTTIRGQTLVLGIARDITLRKQAEQALKKREKELETKTRDLEEVNAALRVLLKKREEDKTELEEKVLSNVTQVIEPYVEKLKKTELDERQKDYLSVLESNLKDIISPFSRAVSSRYLNLTPAELQVANLVKQGKTTKEIAGLLNLSRETIGFHRRNIREKIGIKSKKANLRTHLLSIPE